MLELQEGSKGGGVYLTEGGDLLINNSHLDDGLGYEGGVTILEDTTGKDFKPSEIAKLIADRKGSVLIIGRPGSGKTTLLRDLIRQRSDRVGDTVCVVDERCELFPVA